jgi:uncharacterized coiled-coil protein SlyX
MKHRKQSIRSALFAVALLLPSPVGALAQQNETISQAATLQHLSQALSRTEAEVDHLQAEIRDLKAQVNSLETQLAASSEVPAPPSTPAPASSEAAISDRLDHVQEEQEVQAAEIATHEQAKVESASRLPVRIIGSILLNGFVNSRAVDTPSAPSLVVTGSGATGLSLRQTILGVDVRGPHVLGADTRADVAVDFFGQATQGGYGNSGGLLRLRTAHGVFDWGRTQAFVELDRPLLNPYSPTSLASSAVPPLAWSGDLWNWIPQLGLTHDLRLGEAHILRMQAAMLDVPDAPLFSASSSVSALNASFAENSRYPALEARIGLQSTDEHRGLAIGVGGYFAPHKTTGGLHFDGWAATADLRWALPLRLELTGNVYRGQALGGLGGGAYKDYLFRASSAGGQAIGLDDVGGWFQMKERWTQRLESNAAFGVDNAFAGQLRSFASLPENAAYQQLARNRAFFTNIIFSPSAYVSLSTEYRRLMTSPISTPTLGANLFGVAAAFKF